MSGRVKKGVIVAAGLGTRFLPATKAMPKEMLPVLEKPVIQYLVEEMAQSGITDITLVINPQKKAVQEHFKRDIALEKFLRQKDKYNFIEPLVELVKKVKIHYAMQAEPLGNGHALLCARKFIGTESFVFSDGDSIIDGPLPAVKQVIEIFIKTRKSVIGVQKITDAKLMTKYGNVYGEKLQPERLYQVREIIEKPAAKNVSPHGLIIGGMRYVLTKEIWPLLEKQKKGRDGEIWMADAANELASRGGLYAYEYDGKYFDTGDKLALLKTAMYFAEKQGLI